jgi:hypothetical protein
MFRQSQNLFTLQNMRLRFQLISAICEISLIKNHLLNVFPSASCCNMVLKTGNVVIASFCFHNPLTFSSIKTIIINVFLTFIFCDCIN